MPPEQDRPRPQATCTDKAMVNCRLRPPPEPAYVYITKIHSRDINLRATMPWHQSLSSITISIICKYDVTHKPEVHNVSQRRTTRGPSNGHNVHKSQLRIRHCSSGYAREQTDKPTTTNRRKYTLITTLRHPYWGRSKKFGEVWASRLWNRL